MTTQTADQALAADFKGEGAVLERLRREDAGFQALVAKHHAVFDQLAAAPAAARAQLNQQRQKLLDQMTDYVIEAEENREDRMRS